MSERVPLNADVARIIAEAPEHLNTDADATLEQLRVDAATFYAWLRGPVDPTLANVVTRDEVIDGVPVRWYGAEPDASRDLVVFVHGGGWIAGNIDCYDPDVRLLAQITGATVVSIDYRLAPEHPYPAAIDDCVTVVRHVSRLPHRALAIAGDSAGGNLALGTSLVLRDENLLHALLALYPVVDPEALDNDSYRANGVDYLLTRDAMETYWNLYTPTEDARQDPVAAPSLAKLRGMPSSVIVSADYDPLRDEARELATRLADADVDVTYLPHPGLTHGFQQMVPRVPAAARALQAVYSAFTLTMQREITRRMASAAVVRS